MSQPLRISIVDLFESVSSLRVIFTYEHCSQLLQSSVVWPVDVRHHNDWWADPLHVWPFWTCLFKDPTSLDPVGFAMSPRRVLSRYGASRWTSVLPNGLRLSLLFLNLSRLSNLRWWSRHRGVWAVVFGRGIITLLWVSGLGFVVGLFFVVRLLVGVVVVGHCDDWFLQ